MLVIETERLVLRELTEADFEAAREILGDARVMYAWEHGFSDAETRAWIAENIARYRRDGFSYLAAVERWSGALAGFIGPLVETVDGVRRTGVAYILGRSFWGRGYASEGAAASVDYAFDQLSASEVIAEIRPENSASRRVAERLGMTARESFVKIYKGKEMPHLIYIVTKDETAGAEAGSSAADDGLRPKGLILWTDADSQDLS